MLQEGVVGVLEDGAGEEEPTFQVSDGDFDGRVRGGEGDAEGEGESEVEGRRGREGRLQSPIAVGLAADYVKVLLTVIQ